MGWMEGGIRNVRRTEDGTGRSQNPPGQKSRPDLSRQTRLTFPMFISGRPPVAKTTNIDKKEMVSVQ